VGGAVLSSSCGDDTAAPDHQDAEYVIDGRRIELRDGVAEMAAAPGSAATIVTRYFGNETRHDLNGDGREDVVFLLTQETSGTGVFYYVVAALAAERGYIGSHGVLLGDRIAPRATEMGTGNIVIVSYADRAPEESFATVPSVAKSVWLLLDPEALQFAEVAQDFEGEADPTRMSFAMKPWTWIGVLYGDGRETMPRQADAFTLAFGSDGAFSATTDCNRLGGKYAVSGDRLTFSDIFATRMYCEGSQEGEFADLLRQTERYGFNSRGQLVLSLELGGGSVTFH
jgi:heat shock protein HslJ